MNHGTHYYCGLMLTCCLHPAFANPLPAGMVKVTKENNPQCVEFINYQNEMYCTTSATAQPAPDPTIVANEQQSIHFDDRPWKAAWAKKNDQITTIEYITVGDDINKWHELITSQFIPNLTVSADDFASLVINDLKKQGINPKITLIDKQADQYIFEFQITEPTNLQQDEIQKVTKGKNGIYVLHYVMNKADMGADNRTKWIANMKQSAIK